MKNVEFVFFYILIFASVILGSILLIRVDRSIYEVPHEIAADAPADAPADTPTMQETEVNDEPDMQQMDENEEPELFTIIIHESIVPQAPVPDELLQDETVNDEAFHENIADIEEFTIGNTVYSIDRDQLEKNGIVIRTDFGIYTFLPGQWTAGILTSYVDLLDRSIAYTYDWFEIEQNRPIPVELNPLKSVTGIGGFGSTSGIHIFNAFTFPPWLITHETVHYIALNEDFFNHGYVPIYLSEGISSALMYKQAADDHIYRSVFLERNAGHIDMWPNMNDVLSQLSNIIVYPDGVIDSISLSKLSALYDISRMQVTKSVPSYVYGGLLISGSELGDPHEMVDGFLYTYSTAASFTLFLLDFGGKDRYFKFYMDHGSVEEIYGMDLATLVNIWLYDYLQYDFAVPLILDALEE